MQIIRILPQENICNTTGYVNGESKQMYIVVNFTLSQPNYAGEYVVSDYALTPNITRLFSDMMLAVNEIHKCVFIGAKF